MKTQSLPTILFLTFAPLAGQGADLASPVLLASADASGNHGNGDSDEPSVSADGRVVAFHSMATNFISGDTNGFGDVYVKDLSSGSIVRASTNASGVQGNFLSERPSISGDGTLVAFTSYATNLVAGDGNDSTDVFVKNLNTLEVIRVSSDSSGNGANADSSQAAISENGRFVAFYSGANNLVAGDTNGTADVFVKDLVTGVTIRVSTDSSGGQANSGSSWPSISPDGTYVGFRSVATNLVPDDTNNRDDMFLKNLVSGEIVRVSTTSSGGQANDFTDGALALSSDAGIVAFVTTATNFVGGDSNNAADIIVKNRTTGTVIRASTSTSGAQSLYGAYSPALSGNGRLVTFVSAGSQFVDGDTNDTGDVFVRDLWSGVVTRVTTNADGAQANGGSHDLSSDGKWLAFSSWSTNLVPGNTNSLRQIYVKDVSSLSSPIAELSGLSIGSGTLSPDFSKNVTSYTADVAQDIATTVVTPATSEPGLVIEARVNGGSYSAVASGETSAPLPLDTGTNTVEVRVTSTDLTEKTYTITVTRAAPARLWMKPPRAYPSIQVGRSSRPQTLSVTNLGGSTATIFSIRSSGAARRDFRFARLVMPTLAPGATTTFRATFKPRAEGVRRALVTVRSNTTPVSAALIGRGR